MYIYYYFSFTDEETGAPKVKEFPGGHMAWKWYSRATLGIKVRWVSVQTLQ